MKLFIYIAFFLFIIIVFKTWVLLDPLASGDWSYKFPNMIREFNLYPYAWDTGFLNKLGGTAVFLLGINTYFLFTTSILFNFFHIPWIVIERVVWFWPFLVLSVFSSRFLFEKLFSKKFALFSAFIFLLNTYILMIVGGGQMGIAMAYGLFPLVVYSFIKTFKNLDKKNFKILGFSIITSLLLSVQIIFDLRIAYITLFAVFILWILKVLENKKYFLKSILFIFIIPAILTFLLNAFWIIPTIANGRNPIEQLGSAYSSLEAVKFFSFAKLENALGLLHPNWPENIFGKVGFMKAEFLLLPLLAYSSLLFIKKETLEKRKFIIFFVILGLLGAFLAKGSNEPFGEIFLWMFTYIPGFNMFRDPSKWYTLIALSYSMLIPYSISNIYEYLKSKFN